MDLKPNYMPEDVGDLASGIGIQAAHIQRVNASYWESWKKLYQLRTQNFRPC
jgi:hypothetical protein